MRLKIFMLISLLLLVILRSSYSQNGVSLSTGFGFSELLNIGIRGEIKQIEAGLSIGTIPGLKGGDEKIFSLCGDLYYHFGQVPELSDRSVWYLRTGLNYLSDIYNDDIDKFVYLNLRFGRDLNFSKKIGIQIDAGVNIELYRKSIPATIIKDIIFSIPFMPSIGLNFFYKI